MESSIFTDIQENSLGCLFWLKNKRFPEISLSHFLRFLKATSPTVWLTVSVVFTYVFVTCLSLWVSASEISSKDIPALLAKVAPVCLNLCGEAGESPGYRLRIEFIL